MHKNITCHGPTWWSILLVRYNKYAQRAFFCYIWLPLAVSLIPSIFQRIMETLQGTDGVCVSISGISLWQARWQNSTADSKVEAIVWAPALKNIMELRSLLGLVNYDTQSCRKTILTDAHACLGYCACSSCSPKILMKCTFSYTPNYVAGNTDCNSLTTELQRTTIKWVRQHDIVVYQCISSWRRPKDRNVLYELVGCLVLCLCSIIMVFHDSDLYWEKSEFYWG